MHRFGYRQISGGTGCDMVCCEVLMWLRMRMDLAEVVVEVIWWCTGVQGMVGFVIKGWWLTVL